MRLFILICLLTTSALAQLGTFTDAADVGAPTSKGSTKYDAATGQYKITGAGANMWTNADQFQYVYREMSGNLSVTATVEFVGEGAMPHRKAGIVIRKTLDTDSPMIDVVIHGTGMPGIQWRNTKGDITNAMDFPFDGPGKFKLKLVRTGNTIAVYIAKDGAELKELGHTQVPLGSPVFVGLGVCSHKPDTLETAIFSDVSVEQLPAPQSKKK
jgi:regulation of enolase protein 1 (concanavalin A-like superfamily)